MAARFYPRDSDEPLEEPMAFSHLSTDISHTLIVAVDGACRNNGQNNARAALGVYFNTGNRWNKSEMLPLNDTTSQRAELCAALRALQTVNDFVADEWKSSVSGGKKSKRVIVKSDSGYLVESMTEWIFKWRENGFINARSQPVHNQDLFKKLWDTIKCLDEQKKIKVYFWKVSRARNADADGLANAALDASQAPIWDYRNPPTRQKPDRDASGRVWLWHERLCHMPLRELQDLLKMSKGIDVTHEQIQAEIDEGVRCPSCVAH
ncbi:ribonuclease H-like domain-containing protein [Xylaria longipes]|nr:ribonuclease H-like domain-containing protein [Xylaria longipes]